jgi:hypothetical protein
VRSSRPGHSPRHRGSCGRPSRDRERHVDRRHDDPANAAPGPPAATLVKLARSDRKSQSLRQLPPTRSRRHSGGVVLSGATVAVIADLRAGWSSNAHMPATTARAGGRVSWMLLPDIGHPYRAASIHPGGDMHATGRLPDIETARSPRVLARRGTPWAHGLTLCIVHKR